MCKCRIESEILTTILLRYYNTIIQREFYPEYWLKVLDMMLDKGKGLIIGKLQTIQLIEADSQLLMRIFLGIRIENFIKKDSRISKFNFRLQKFFLIEEVILEKRIICANSK